MVKQETFKDCKAGLLVSQDTKHNLHVIWKINVCNCVSCKWIPPTVVLILGRMLKCCRTDWHHQYMSRNCL